MEKLSLRTIDIQTSWKTFRDLYFLSDIFSLNNMFSLRNTFSCVYSFLNCEDTGGKGFFSLLNPYRPFVRVSFLYNKCLSFHFLDLGDFSPREKRQLSFALLSHIKLFPLLHPSIQPNQSLSHPTRYISEQTPKQSLLRLYSAHLPFFLSDKLKGKKKNSSKFLTR